MKKNWEQGIALVLSMLFLLVLSLLVLHLLEQGLLEKKMAYHFKKKMLSSEQFPL